jgi:hypothetical protein
MPTVSVHDETSAGERLATHVLDLLTERVTARELILSRVYQEVTEHNARPAGRPAPAPIVEPSAAERLLNGERDRRERLDWQVEYARALRAFERNGFLLLADDRQLLDLDDEVKLRPGAEVVFLRLVPLIGG